MGCPQKGLQKDQLEGSSAAKAHTPRSYQTSSSASTSTSTQLVPYSPFAMAPCHNAGSYTDVRSCRPLFGSHNVHTVWASPQGSPPSILGTCKDSSPRHGTANTLVAQVVPPLVAKGIRHTAAPPLTDHHLGGDDFCDPPRHYMAPAI